MKILFLDENINRKAVFFTSCRERHPGATLRWVSTAQECIESLKEDWDYICLDHDLGGEIFVSPEEENSGSAVVRWIKNNKEVVPQNALYIVHSFNPVEANNMTQDLNKLGFKTRRIPFGYSLLGAI